MSAKNKFGKGIIDVEDLPRISRCSRRFGSVQIAWRCVGRASEGFGATPLGAYQAWQRNWRRRVRRERALAMQEREWAQKALARESEPQKMRAPGKVKTYSCKYCEEKNLVWLTVGGRWMLHSAVGVRHLCDSFRQPEGAQ